MPRRKRSTQQVDLWTKAVKVKKLDSTELARLSMHLICVLNAAKAAAEDQSSGSHYKKWVQAGIKEVERKLVAPLRAVIDVEYDKEEEEEDNDGDDEI